MLELCTKKLCKITSLLIDFTLLLVYFVVLVVVACQ